MIMMRSKFYYKQKFTLGVNDRLWGGGKLGGPSRYGGILGVMGAGGLEWG